MSEPIPQSVLAEAIQEQIAGRRVRVAVFTTFTFDPGFFELHVLPCLFDRPFSPVDKVRRIQLEDALRSLEEVAVYYDRTGLAQEAQPAQLDFRRFDVRRRTGVFHPKLVLLLVDQPSSPNAPDDTPPQQALIAATLSANLTRAGWWENVETGHIEEIRDQEEDPRRCPFRRDLLDLIGQLRRCAPSGEEHAALSRIHDFVRYRSPSEEHVHNSSGGRFYTRLFMGQQNLPAWLAEIGLPRRDWNLEIISPYFDAADATTLATLCEVLGPHEVRLFLPQELDGTALVAETFFGAVADRRLATWSTLPDYVVKPGGRKATQNAAPRRVHAKLYRLWNRDGQEVVLCGSVNLTGAAHSHAGAGNLEAAFLTDVSGKQGKPSWWLRPLEKQPAKFAETPPHEDEDTNEAPIDLTLRFDWSCGTLAYRLSGLAEGPVTIAEVSGRMLFTLPTLQPGDWVNCDQDAGASICDLLKSTSFVEVQHAKGAWRILVREEGMSHRPSLLFELTPDEILLYWSLLSLEQREAFVTSKLATLAQLEGLPAGHKHELPDGDTIFDRFAGVFHGFSRLENHVRMAIQAGQVREAEARLFGAKYDSLPVLLQKVHDDKGGDSVIRYLTFLCAQQVYEDLTTEFPEFCQAHTRAAAGLKAALQPIGAMRSALSLGKDHDAFLNWYERMFLSRAKPAEEVA